MKCLFQKTRNLPANRLMTLTKTALILACCFAWMGGAARAAGADAKRQAAEILRTSGIQGGLVAHIHAGDGRLTAVLRRDARYVVHGLDTDANRVSAARKRFASMGLHGPVSAEVFDGRHLPYVDNLVNLVVCDKLRDVPIDEVLRVLAPEGVAIVNGRKIVKPRPADLDEWTHFLHDASNNAVSTDQQVGNPRGLRWTAPPLRTRDHDALASLSAMTTSAGRVFYIIDEGPTSLIHRPAAWRLVARDAMNGVLLWKREIPTWATHLWNFRAGPPNLAARLVSVGDRVYVTLGIDAAVSELDAATGKTLRTFDGSVGAEEIIRHRDVLLTVIGDQRRLDENATDVPGYWKLTAERAPTAAKKIIAYRPDTGEVLWTRAGDAMGRLAPLSVCADGERVFFLVGDELQCVSLDGGKPLWKAPMPMPDNGLFLYNYTPTVLARDGVVMCLTWNRLRAVAAKDGRKLWDHGGAIGFGSPGDLFAIDGLAWCVPITAQVYNGSRKDRRGKASSGIPIPKESFLGNGGKEIWGMDLGTGEVKKAIPRSKVLPGGHHHRCYRNKATERYLICGRRGLEFVDLVGDRNVNNWWVRGICQYGVMPANGLTYVPPTPCACFNQIKVPGLLALSASTALDAAGKPDGDAPKAGAAANDRSARLPAPPAKDPDAGLSWRPPARPAKADEWPTYRGDITRSGSTTTPVPPRLAPLWKAKLAGTLTAPVAAGGKLWVCGKDAQTLWCLDAAEGKPVWSFLAGGRLDSPPTIHGDKCLLGCRDGYVVCLRADDGRVVWRTRVAPADRRIVDDSRVESAWPVSGSVLVLGTGSGQAAAYCAAGRSSYLDGGIRMVALDVRTGALLGETTITSKPGPLGQSRPPTYGALPDVLVSDGRTINMRFMRFDLKLNKLPGRAETLHASTGLLEDTWAHREPWRLGQGKSQAASGCKLAVFDAACVYGVANPYTYLKKTRSMWPDTHDGHLHQKYSRYKASQFPIGVKLTMGRNIRAADKRRGRDGQAPADASAEWSLTAPIQPRAMVLAADRLFLAGWRDAVAIRELSGRPLDADNPEPRPAFLAVRSTEDGREIASYPLDAEPAFDGLIAAYGKLYLAMSDGTVRCFGAAK